MHRIPVEAHANMVSKTLQRPMTKVVLVLHVLRSAGTWEAQGCLQVCVRQEAVQAEAVELRGTQQSWQHPRHATSGTMSLAEITQTGIGTSKILDCISLVLEEVGPLPWCEEAGHINGPGILSGKFQPSVLAHVHSHLRLLGAIGVHEDIGIGGHGLETEVAKVPDQVISRHGPNPNQRGQVDCRHVLPATTAGPPKVLGAECGSRHEVAGAHDLREILCWKIGRIFQGDHLVAPMPHFAGPYVEGLCVN